jgi:3-hydroxyisobutyrate dehydrogenase
MPEIKTVGYIGLGLAGGPLAQNICKANYRLIVRDADKQRQQEFVTANSSFSVEAAPECPEGFKEVDLLITMVPNGHIVRDILLGTEGIAPYLKPGSCQRKKPSYYLSLDKQNIRCSKYVLI